MSVREKKCAHGFYSLEACHNRLLECITGKLADRIEYGGEWWIRAAAFNHIAHELEEVRKAEKGWHADEERMREELQRKVRELKAELAEYRSAERIYGRHFAERAEKAEAEVERLGSHLRLHCHEEDASKCYYEGVNPSGEPLGRKERDDG